MDVISLGVVSEKGITLTMGKLFVDIEDQNVPIDQNIVNKYDLKDGMISPFTKKRIVGKYKTQSHVEKDKIVDDERKSAMGVGSGRLSDGVELSTSEILDFSQGADSD